MNKFIWVILFGNYAYCDIVYNNEYPFMIRQWEMTGLLSPVLLLKCRIYRENRKKMYTSSINYYVKQTNKYNK